MSSSSKTDDENNLLSTREDDNSTTSTDKRSLPNQSNSRKENPQGHKVELHKAKKNADLRLPSSMRDMSSSLHRKQSVEIRNEFEEKVVITPNPEIILKNYDLCAVDSDDEIN